MKIQDKYQPISCYFYDLLIEFATKKETVEVTYLMDNTPQNILDVSILDVFTQKGEEFMKLSSGQLIRLDHLISVNDHKLPGNKSCTL